MFPFHSSIFQQMASDSQRRIIQITGFKKLEKKALLRCLWKLRHCSDACGSYVYIDSKVLFITIQQRGLEQKVKMQALEERTVQ